MVNSGLASLQRTWNIRERRSFVFFRLTSWLLLLCRLKFTRGSCNWSLTGSTSCKWKKCRIFCRWRVALERKKDLIRYLPRVDSHFCLNWVSLEIIKESAYWMLLDSSGCLVSLLHILCMQIKIIHLCCALFTWVIVPLKYDDIFV